METGKIAFCVSVYERHDLLRRLIASLRDFHPEAKVYVADDSETPQDVQCATKTLFLETDAGLSAKRNALIEATEEPYICVLDEDYVWTEDTNLDHLWAVLEERPEVGLAGGQWLQNGKQLSTFHGEIRLDGDTLWHLRQEDPDWQEAGDVRFCYTDATHNYFLARREVLEQVPYDNRLKLAEHTDWLLRFKRETEWQMAYVPSAQIEHQPGGDRDYVDDRRRGRLYKYLFMRKWGIERWYRKGQCIAGPELMNSTITDWLEKQDVYE